MKAILRSIVFRVLVIGVLHILMVSEVNAQYKSATIGIDGLTCSMCSNSVEKLMRQLDFVADVEMDLNSTTAQVTFHPGKKVRISDLAKKVHDAGFSVRVLQAVFVFDNTEAKEGSRFPYEGDEYVFVKAANQKLSGETTITFIGKNYMSKKEFTHWKSTITKYKGTSNTKSQLYHIVL